MDIVLFALITISIILHILNTLSNKKMYIRTKKILNELIAMTLEYPDRLDEQLKITEASMGNAIDFIKIKKEKLEKKENENVYAKMV